jgi:hypothetical protein
MLQLMKQDVVLFPFPDKDLNGGLGGEQGRTIHYGFKVMDIDEFKKTKGSKFKGSAQLVVIAHGSGDQGYTGLLKGDTNTMITAVELADVIGPSGFVKTRDNGVQSFMNEIYIWSCMSGVQGGFASQFAREMKRYGVTQLNIYGSTRNTAPVNAKGQLMVKEDGQNARPAIAGDMTVYWGANL